MYRLCLTSLIAITCASVAWAEEQRELTVAPGAEIVVSQPHNWQRDCTTRPMQIEPVEMPAQGQLIFTTATYKIGDFGPGKLVSGSEDAPCLGQDIFGLQLRFRAAPDAAGEDGFSLRARTQDGRQVLVRYTVRFEGS